ncbi:MAG: hypothetical protein PUB08_05205 [Firmicutes bacterium]|nr:hypothetical protein [Bacillota bacterium]
MNIKEYLGRYAALQKAIARDQKMLKLIESQKSGILLNTLAAGSFSEAGQNIVESLISDSERLKKKIRARTRLYEKYTVKITKAIMLMKSQPQKDYIITRYLYGFSCEKVAEMNHYCERQIYRQAQEARRSLYLALLTLKPKLKRITGKRFVITRHLQNPKPFHRKRCPGVFTPHLNTGA